MINRTNYKLYSLITALAAVIILKNVSDYIYDGHLTPFDAVYILCRGADEYVYGNVKGEGWNVST